MADVKLGQETFCSVAINPQIVGKGETANTPQIMNSLSLSGSMHAVAVYIAAPFIYCWLR